MSDKLQPYEISLWDDVLVEENEKTYYKEVKIATIGSDVMTAPSRVINPIFTANVNGEITLTFSIVHRYYDDLEDDYIFNPFERYLVNERKVKLFYDNEWYDFVIKSCEESSDSNMFNFTAKGLFVNELGKVGYNVVLSNDLKNNQGTIFELAEKAVEGTDWIIDKENSDIIQQFVAEPLYIYKNTAAFNATKLNPDEEVPIAKEETLYLFYSSITNKQTEYVQFLRQEDFKNSTLDNNNVAQMPNYRFTGEANYDGAPATVIIGDVTLQLQTSDSNPTGINTAFQGYRLAYNKLTGYDTLKDRPVELYEATYEDGSKKTIYKYTDYEYVTSDVVMSYITGGSGFSVYGDDEGLDGWSNMTPTDKIALVKSIAGLKINDEVGVSFTIKNPQELILKLYNTVKDTDTTITEYEIITKKNNQNKILIIRYLSHSSIDLDTIEIIENNVTHVYSYSDTGTHTVAFANDLGIITNITTNRTARTVNEIQEALADNIFFTTANNATSGGYTPQKLDLVSYPDIGSQSIVDLTQLNGIRNFLRIKFQGYGGPTNNYNNMIYNSGLDDNRSLIGSFSKGEEYVFRIAYGTTIEDGGQPLANLNSAVKAVVAKYTLKTQKIWDEKTQTEEIAYLYTVDPNNILFEFDGPFELRNNEITGGTFRKNDQGQYEAYYKDGVSITPSVDYCYIEGEAPNQIVAIWDMDEGIFKVKDPNNKTFLDYYHTIATCKKAISNTELSNDADDYGIFLYTDNADLLNSNKYVCIKEVQFFKAKRDGDNVIVLPGNVPKSTSLATDFFYLKPEEDETDENSIETYSTLDALADSLALPVESIKALYNENFEKISSIEASQSNCFNIIQDLCEAFECWARFNIDHEKNGAIRLNSDGAPSKKISFHIYSGDDNFAGFKYGINLESIERTIDSDEFVSKLIVEQVANDVVDGGTVSIAGAASNPSGESYILNMSYYINQGLIEDPDQYYSDYNSFISQLKDKNLDYTAKKVQLQLANIARTKANKNTNVYQELVEAAKKDYDETILQFEDLTGLTYDKYVKGNGYWIEFKKNGSNLVGTFSKVIEEVTPSYFDSNGQEIYLTVTSELESEDKIIRTYALDSSVIGQTSGINDIKFICIVDKIVGFDVLGYDGSYSTYINRWPSAVMPPDILSRLTAYIWELGTNAHPSNLVNYPLNINIIPNKDNDTLIDLVGKIYTDQITIRDYEPLLLTSREEKKDLDILIDGTKDYTLTVSTFSKNVDGVLTNVTKERLDDYVEGLKFTLSSDVVSWDIETTITEKFFEQNELYTYIYFSQYPSNYKLKYILNGETYISEVPVRLPLVVNGSKTFTLIPVEEQKGIKDLMEEILDEKNTIEKEFYKKYSRFIQEGAWTSSDYIDDELYYLDALNVSKVNGQPKVSYNLAVYEISEQEGLQNYKFNIGDKTYIEDTQFFGYHNNIVEKLYEATAIDDIIQLPIGVSDVLNIYQVVPGEGEFDHKAKFIYYPSSETIEITNKYSENSDDYIIQLSYRILTPIREEVVVSEVEWHLDNPHENSITIQNYKTQFDDLFQRMAAAVQSVEYNSASYSRAASMLDEGGFINAGLLLKSLNELAGGFNLSGDGTITAAPDGIIVKDIIDPTRQIKLAGSGLKVSTDDGYNWNTVITADGLNINTINTQEVIIKDGDNPSFRWDTYGLNAYGYGDEGTDLKTYVRFDKYGLYGVQNGEDFQASSLDDIKDTAQFGLLWDGFFIKNSYTDGYVSISSDNDFQVVANDQERIKIGALERNFDGSYEYGIRIKNSDGDNVFITDDTGNITMTGVINAQGGTFTDEVRVGSSENAIIIQGSEDEAIIGSSQYFDDSSKGWAITSYGDAIFNNITARGAIKTAVFEYEEIEAVGGIFIFRPSSTIKNAEIPSTITYEYEKVVTGDMYDLDPEETYYIKVDNEYIEVDNPVQEDASNYYIKINDDPEEYEKLAPNYVIEPDTTNYYIKNGDDYILVEDPTQENIEDYYVINDEGTVTYSGDLLLQVEKPLLFSIGDWCKVSNFNYEDPTTALNASGLVNVFEISDISNNILTLNGGADMFNDIISAAPEPTEEGVLNGNNNIYQLSMESDFTEKYNYEIYYIDPEDETSENYVVAQGTPSDLIITAGQLVSTVKYLGNAALWSETEEDTGEDFLIIQQWNPTQQQDQLYLYVDETNYLYNAGQLTDFPIQIQKQKNVAYEVNSLVGGALISFANYPYSKTAIATIDKAKIDNAKIDCGTPGVLSHNYGVGINSSDSAVNLPARAITLFESQIDPEDRSGIKVHYAIRGLFGTLPTADVLTQGKGYTNPNKAVDTDVYNHMAGQQGVYTDNIYLGNENQYLAFYNEGANKKLKIRAKEFLFETGESVLDKATEDFSVYLEDYWFVTAEDEMENGTKRIDTSLPNGGDVHISSDSIQLILDHEPITLIQILIDSDELIIIDDQYYTVNNREITFIKTQYFKTTDESIDPNKTYYTYNEEEEVYIKVLTPIPEELSNYYNSTTNDIIIDEGTQIIAIYEAKIGESNNNTIPLWAKADDTITCTSIEKAEGEIVPDFPDNQENSTDVDPEKTITGIYGRFKAVLVQSEEIKSLDNYKYVWGYLANEAYILSENAEEGTIINE